MGFDVDALTSQLIKNYPYELALKAFKRAEIHECIDLSYACDSAQSQLLRARSFLRLRLPADALRELDGMPNMITRAQQAEEAILFALTYIELADFEEAHDYAKNANVYAVTFEPFEAETLTTWARIRLCRGNTKSALASADNALKIRKQSRYLPGEPSHYIMPLDDIHAQAHDLRGKLFAEAGDYSAQYSSLGEAFLLGGGDLCLSAEYLENRAILACEFADATCSESISLVASSMAWTKCISHERAFIARSLGWCMALRGDFSAAQTQFQFAHSCSTAPEIRLAATLDQLKLARASAREDTVAALTGYVDTLAAEVAWDTVRPSERCILLMLAEERSAASPTQAQAALQTYRSLCSPVGCRRDRTENARMGCLCRRTHYTLAWARGTSLRSAHGGIFCVAQDRLPLASCASST